MFMYTKLKFLHVQIKMHFLLYTYTIFITAVLCLLGLLRIIKFCKMSTSKEDEVFMSVFETFVRRGIIFLVFVFYFLMR